MLETLLTFLPVAAVLTVTPGIATALVIRSAVRGGRREALAVTVGNSLGVLAWAIFAAVGVAAVVAASAELFTTIKLAGAIVLVILGVQGLLARKAEHEPPPPGTALRVGLARRASPTRSSRCSSSRCSRSSSRRARRCCRARSRMAATIVALDLVWYSALAWGVAAHAPRVRGPLAAARGAADGRACSSGSRQARS